jgi:WD40 repeat protein/tRNA A-37 threonylcarbamoyl transferase component Bud32
MTASSGWPIDFTGEAARELEQWVARFEQAWEEGVRPALDDYLPADEPPRRAVLAELVHADLEYRLKAGEPARVEEYLARYPELEPQRGLVLRLIATEYELRRRQSPPAPAEYGARFPQYAGELAARLPPPAAPRPLCPQCRQPVELPAGGGTTVTCPACGSTFRLGHEEFAAPPAAAPARLGRFELLEVVGRGAFGVVYRARDTELDRVVAVKVPRLGTLTSPEEIDRFLREARSAAQLQHPGIVAVHDAGHGGGTCFVVCDFVAGPTLAEVLQTRPPTAEEAARLAAGVADALHYAHAHGVVHRDVKPSNILLGEDGAPHLTDFGLARRDAGEATITLDGQVLGTPAYMSPEQAGGEAHAVDGRSDVYSLGVVLYQLLTGELPFRGTTRMLLHQVLHDEPRPPRRLNDRIPRDLETVCLKAMAKEPARRYPTAGELADDLHRFLKGEPVRARPVGRGERLRRWCRRNPALAAACGLAALSLVATAAVAVAFGVYQSEAAGRLRDSLADSEANRRQLDRANADLEATDQRRREGLRLAGSLALERGLALGDKDEAGRGLLWLARGLEIVPAEEADLRRALRANLAAWSSQVCPLEAASPIPALASAKIVAFSPDGRTLLTGAADGTFRLWESATGRPVGGPLRHPGELRSAAFSPDGRVVATGGYDNTARLWEAATGRSIGPPLRHDGPVAALAFSPDGRVVVTAGEDNTARLWEAATGRRVGEPLRHPDWVWAAAFSPDGKTLATGGGDGFARFWEVATGKPLGPPMQHHRQILALAFSPDGRTLATASADSTARLWEVPTGRHRGAQMRHDSWVHAVAFRAGGQWIVTGSEDNTARLWEAATGQPQGAPMAHRGRVLAAAFGPGGGDVLTAGDDQVLRRWRMPRGTAPAARMRHLARVRGVGFRPDGTALLTASEDGTARLWNPATGGPVGVPLPHPGAVVFVAAGRNGRAVLTVCRDGAARVWDAEAGRAVATFRLPPDDAEAVALSPDGRTLLTGSREEGGRAQRWDAATGVRLGPPLPLRYGARAVAFSPDGRWIATGCGDAGRSAGEARLWDAATGRPLGPPLPHPGEVTAVAFSPDGRRLLTGCADRHSRLWDLPTGRLVGRPWQHHAALAAVALSPDSKTAATAGSELGQAQLWDLATGKPLGPPLPHGAHVETLAFSPDGRTLVTGDDAGVVRLWPVWAPLAGDDEGLVTWAQVETGMELDDTGTAHVLDAPTWRERRRRLDELGGGPPR